MDVAVKIEERNEEEILVKMSNVDLSVMTAFRRNAIWEVESMCMENLEILCNTSNIDDEKLAHRLGQIPFTSQDAKKYSFADKCYCKEGCCDRCAVVYTLNVKNIDDSKMRDVTTIDLKRENESTTVRPTHTDDEGKDDTNSIYICTLFPGQEISLTGIVRKGTAKKEKHHKYQPTALVGLKCPAIIKLDQHKLSKLTEEQKKEIVRSATDKIFQYDEKTGILSTTEDPNDCRSCTHNHKCEELVDSYGQPDAIQIIPKEDYFLLTVSTNGCLRPEEILLWSMENFLESLKQIHFSLAMSEEL
jgi:DNA-directed RNA polymerase subunit D